MPTYRHAVPSDRWDLVIVGGGAAGLTILEALAQHPTQKPLSILVCDDRTPLRDQPHDRTWCYWDTQPPHDQPQTPPVTKDWTKLKIATSTHDRILRPHPYRYALLTSNTYYKHINNLLATTPHLNIVWTNNAQHVQPDTPTTHVTTNNTHHQAPLVLDSRPRTTWPTHDTLLWQHFYGVFVDSPTNIFDPNTATLMDFATPQPETGVAFGYVLPLTTTKALIEYTEFSPHKLTTNQYKHHWENYVETRLPCSPQHLTATTTETGCIPMTDATLEQHTPTYRRLGTAGGATRPSTGYTFRAMQRTAQTIAHNYLTNQELNSKPHYPRRHHMMDAILLKALANHNINGVDFFDRLFARNSAANVLRYLDGDTTPTQDLALMATSKTTPMITTVAQQTLQRVRGMSQ